MKPALDPQQPELSAMAVLAVREPLFWEVICLVRMEDSIPMEEGGNRYWGV